MRPQFDEHKTFNGMLLFSGAWLAGAVAFIVGGATRHPDVAEMGLFIEIVAGALWLVSRVAWASSRKQK